jgi:NADH-quinone oxidoreductase subunit F
MDRIMTRIVEGEAEMDELDRLHEVANNIMGNTICAFGEGSAMPMLGFLKKFRREFEEHVRTRGASSTRTLEAGGSPG